MREFMSIDSADAQKVVSAVIAEASSDGGKPIAVCVLDVRGVQLAAACMDGASEANVRTAHAKCVTALEFQRDTREFRHIEYHGIWVDPDKLSDEDIDLSDDRPQRPWPDHHVINGATINPSFCSFAGGVLVRDDNGAAIGSIAVSGRAELDDHTLVVETIAKTLN